MTSQQNIAILGASGYTGAELIRLLRHHPHCHIAALSANQHAGKAMGDVFPHLAHYDLPELQKIDDINVDTIDTIFCCLPHAASQEIIATLPANKHIIDLSADFRLRDAATYEQWYNTPHTNPQLQTRAVYGLTEYYREQVRSATLIANPGCYPTCALLPLIPLVGANIVDPSSIIIDAKSGVSGAGRGVKQGLLYNELAEGMTAYNVHAHRHIPEIEQELNRVSTQDAGVTFTPHLIPMRRGMLSTIYVNLRDGHGYMDAKAELVSALSDEAFVHILTHDRPPSTHEVRATNQCHVNVFAGRNTSQAIIVSVIDNVMKGASGQALQNFNLMHGYDETLGLTHSAVFP